MFGEDDLREKLSNLEIESVFVIRGRNTTKSKGSGDYSLPSLPVAFKCMTGTCVIIFVCTLYCSDASLKGMLWSTWATMNVNGDFSLGQQDAWSGFNAALCLKVG